MSTKIRIGGDEYAAIIGGHLFDASWDGRDTKTIHLEMTHAQAASLFVDDVEWWIINDYIDPETHEPVHEEFDNSDYCVAGDITDHRDGAISVVMGRETDLEEAYELLYGGE